MAPEGTHTSFLSTWQELQLSFYRLVKTFEGLVCEKYLVSRADSVGLDWHITLQSRVTVGSINKAHGWCANCHLI